MRETQTARVFAQDSAKVRHISVRQPTMVYTQVDNNFCLGWWGGGEAYVVRASKGKRRVMASTTGF